MQAVYEADISSVANIQQKPLQQYNLQTVLDNDNFYLSEIEDMGSLNHSYLQLKLGTLFLQMKEYIALTELSLDTSPVKEKFPLAGDSVVADVAVYPAREINLAKDVLKMSEMPLLVIEILSPMQATQLLVDKLAIYFALGVPSCWIVYPSAQTVSVFSAPYQFHSFSSGSVEDTVLGLKLPIEQNFG